MSLMRTARPPDGDHVIQGVDLNHGFQDGYKQLCEQLHASDVNPDSGHYLYVGEAGPLLNENLTVDSDESITLVDTDAEGEQKRASILRHGHSTNDNQVVAESDAQQYVYNLRPGFRTHDLEYSTWLDKDESGDYDPYEKAPRQARHKQRPGTAFVDVMMREESDSSNEVSDERRQRRKFRRVSELLARQHGASHIVTLKLSSDQGKSLLATGSDHWPDEGWKLGTTCVLADEEVPQHRLEGAETQRTRRTVIKPRKRYCAEKLQNDSKVRQISFTPTITTRFSHPIEFNHDDPKNLQSCHFCTDPTFSFFGLGERVVRQSETSNGTSEFEHGSGEPTRLCISCTMSYIRRIVCNPHIVTAIPPSYPQQPTSFTETFERLRTGCTLPGDHWCSVCPSIALYKCSSSSEHSLDDSGCGLQLCETCAVELVEAHRGHMDSFLNTLVDKPTTDRPLGLRADVELLRAGGPLARWMIEMAS
ncbi:hypothetical protein MBLNU459_g3475t1 [Dothideomycetes sp. NU459]